MKTREILAILAFLLVVIGNAFANLPPDWHKADIRSWTPRPGGTVSYDEATITWTVTTPGYSGDLLYQHKCYVYKEWWGDGQITARIHNAYGGVMIRHSLVFGSPGWKLSVSSSRAVLYDNDEGVLSAGGPFGYGKDIEGLPYWVRLERKDDRITAYVSRYGVSPWTEVGSHTDTLEPDRSELDPLYIGFYVPTRRDECAVRFDNVNIGPPGTDNGTSGPDNDWRVSGSNMYSIPTGNIGIGTQNPRAKLDVVGRIRISKSSGEALVELGEGLDYAEGFNVSDENKIETGSVLIIDPAHPGKLVISKKAYDTKVAGIVAGAKGLGSGVRLGSGQFDYDVALAGRVYCNVDATTSTIEPGDLLTTSDKSGYAMKAVDYEHARGAILGKAMEKLEKGKKGQILVLVTLQ